MEHLKRMLWCSTKIPPSGRLLGVLLANSSLLWHSQDLPSADGSCLTQAYTSSLETGSQCRGNKGQRPGTLDSGCLQRAIQLWSFPWDGTGPLSQLRSSLKQPCLPSRSSSKSTPSTPLHAKGGIFESVSRRI